MPRSRNFIRWCKWGALLFLVLLSPYGCSRLLSTRNAVSLETVFPPVPVTNRVGLQIVSYNIAHGRGPVPGGSNWGGDSRERSQRLTDIGGLLRELDADIAVLNEVDFDTTWSRNVDQAGVIARAAELPFVARQRNLDVVLPFFRWRFGNAVLSRHPIQSVELVRFDPLSLRENLMAGNHDALLATIELPDQSKVAVLAVHLEVRSEAIRLLAAERILALHRQLEMPLLVVGDFNSSPSDFPMASPVEGDGTAIDRLAKGHRFGFFPSMTLPLEHPTFPSAGADRTIDWVLYPRGWRLETGGVAQVEFSDHLPVWARVLRIAPD